MRQQSILLLVGLTAFFKTYPNGQEELKAVLGQVGLTPQQLEALEKVDDAGRAAFKPDEFVTSVKTGIKNSLLNDSEFLSSITPDKIPDTIKKEIEKGQYGRFMNETKDFVEKQLGIDIKDLSDDDAKSLKKVLTKSFEKYGSKINSPEAVQKMQNDLQKALQEKAELQTSSQKRLDEELGKERDKMTGVLQKLFTKNELAQLKGLKVKPGMVTDTVLNQINEKYTLVLEGENVKVMQKANPTLKALDDKGAELTFKDVVNTIAISEELVETKKEDDKTEGGGSTTVVVGGEGSTGIPAYIKAKIDANKSLDK